MAAIPLAPPQATITAANRWNAAAAIIGGLTVIAGTALPWLSTLAGLRPLTGLDGINGRVLAAGGVITIILGVAVLRTGLPLLRVVTPLAGFALLGFSSWLLLALLTTYHQLAADPLTLPRIGPGLLVTTAGAALTFAPLLRRGSRIRESTAAAMRTDVPTIAIAASSLLAGFLHLAVAGDHWSESPATATAFTAVGLLQITLAAAMVLHRSRGLLATAIAVNAAAILAWALARSGMLPFLHTGDHHSQGVVVATITAEAIVVLVGMAAQTPRRSGDRKS